MAGISQQNLNHVFDRDFYIDLAASAFPDKYQEFLEEFQGDTLGAHRKLYNYQIDKWREDKKFQKSRGDVRFMPPNWEDFGNQKQISYAQIQKNYNDRSQSDQVISEASNDEISNILAKAPMHEDRWSSEKMADLFRLKGESRDYALSGAWAAQAYFHNTGRQAYPHLGDYKPGVYDEVAAFAVSMADPYGFLSMLGGQMAFGGIGKLGFKGLGKGFNAANRELSKKLLKKNYTNRLAQWSKSKVMNFADDKVIPATLSKFESAGSHFGGWYGFSLGGHYLSNLTNQKMANIEAGDPDKELNRWAAIRDASKQSLTDGFIGLTLGLTSTTLSKIQANASKNLAKNISKSPGRDMLKKWGLSKLPRLGIEGLQMTTLTEFHHLYNEGFQLEHAYDKTKYDNYFDYFTHRLFSNTAIIAGFKTNQFFIKTSLTLGKLALSVKRGELTKGLKIKQESYDKMNQTIEDVDGNIVKLDPKAIEKMAEDIAVDKAEITYLKNLLQIANKLNPFSGKFLDSVENISRNYDGMKEMIEIIRFLELTSEPIEALIKNDAEFRKAVESKIRKDNNIADDVKLPESWINNTMASLSGKNSRVNQLVAEMNSHSTKGGKPGSETELGKKNIFNDKEMALTWINEIKNRFKTLKSEFTPSADWWKKLKKLDIFEQVDKISHYINNELKTKAEIESIIDGADKNISSNKSKAKKDVIENSYEGQNGKLLEIKKKNALEASKSKKGKGEGGQETVTQKINRIVKEDPSLEPHKPSLKMRERMNRGELPTLEGPQKNKNAEVIELIVDKLKLSEPVQRALINLANKFSKKGRNLLELTKNDIHGFKADMEAIIEFYEAKGQTGSHMQMVQGFKKFFNYIHKSPSLTGQKGTDFIEQRHIRKFEEVFEQEVYRAGRAAKVGELIGKLKPAFARFKEGIYSFAETMVKKGIRGINVTYEKGGDMLKNAANLRLRLMMASESFAVRISEMNNLTRKAILEIDGKYYIDITPGVKKPKGEARTGMWKVEISKELYNDLIDFYKSRGISENQKIFDGKITVTNKATGRKMTVKLDEAVSKFQLNKAGETILDLFGTIGKVGFRGTILKGMTESASLGWLRKKVVQRFTDHMKEIRSLFDLIGAPSDGANLEQVFKRMIGEKYAIGQRDVLKVWYEGLAGGKKKTIEVSQRLIRDLMQGKITPEKFVTEFYRELKPQELDFITNRIRGREISKKGYVEGDVVEIKQEMGDTASKKSKFRTKITNWIKKEFDKANRNLGNIEAVYRKYQEALLSGVDPKEVAKLEAWLISNNSSAFQTIKAIKAFKKYVQIEVDAQRVKRDLDKSEIKSPENLIDAILSFDIGERLNKLFEYVNPKERNISTQSIIALLKAPTSSLISGFRMTSEMVKDWGKNPSVGKAIERIRKNLVNSLVKRDVRDISNDFLKALTQDIEIQRRIIEVLGKKSYEKIQKKWSQELASRSKEKGVSFFDIVREYPSILPGIDAARKFVKSLSLDNALRADIGMAELIKLPAQMWIAVDSALKVTSLGIKTAKEHIQDLKSMIMAENPEFKKKENEQLLDDFANEAYKISKDPALVEKVRLEVINNVRAKFFSYVKNYLGKQTQVEIDEMKHIIAEIAGIDISQGSGFSLKNNTKTDISDIIKFEIAFEDFKASNKAQLHKKPAFWRKVSDIKLTRKARGIQDGSWNKILDMFGVRNRRVELANNTQIKLLTEYLNSPEIMRGESSVVEQAKKEMLEIKRISSSPGHKKISDLISEITRKGAKSAGFLMPRNDFLRAIGLPGLANKLELYTSSLGRYQGEYGIIRRQLITALASERVYDPVFKTEVWRPIKNPVSYWLARLKSKDMLSILASIKDVSLAQKIYTQNSKQPGISVKPGRQGEKFSDMRFVEKKYGAYGKRQIEVIEKAYDTKTWEHRKDTVEGLALDVLQNWYDGWKINLGEVAKRTFTVKQYGKFIKQYGVNGERWIKNYGHLRVSGEFKNHFKKGNNFYEAFVEKELPKEVNKIIREKSGLTDAEIRNMTTQEKMQFSIKKEGTFQSAAELARENIEISLASRMQFSPSEITADPLQRRSMKELDLSYVSSPNFRGPGASKAKWILNKILPKGYRATSEHSTYEIGPNSFDYIIGGYTYSMGRLLSAMEYFPDFVSIEGVSGRKSSEFVFRTILKSSLVKKDPQLMNIAKASVEVIESALSLSNKDVPLDDIRRTALTPVTGIVAKAYLGIPLVHGAKNVLVGQMMNYSAYGNATFLGWLKAFSADYRQNVKDMGLEGAGTRIYDIGSGAGTSKISKWLKMPLDFGFGLGGTVFGEKFNRWSTDYASIIALKQHINLANYNGKSFNMQKNSKESKRWLKTWWNLNDRQIQLLTKHGIILERTGLDNLSTFSSIKDKGKRGTEIREYMETVLKARYMGSLRTQGTTLRGFTPRFMDTAYISDLLLFKKMAMQGTYNAAKMVNLGRKNGTIFPLFAQMAGGLFGASILAAMSYGMYGKIPDHQDDNTKMILNNIVQGEGFIGMLGPITQASFSGSDWQQVLGIPQLSGLHDTWVGVAGLIRSWNNPREAGKDIYQQADESLSKIFKTYGHVKKLLYEGLKTNPLLVQKEKIKKAYQELADADIYDLVKNRNYVTKPDGSIGLEDFFTEDSNVINLSQFRKNVQDGFWLLDPKELDKLIYTYWTMSYTQNYTKNGGLPSSKSIDKAYKETVRLLDPQNLIEISGLNLIKDKNGTIKWFKRKDGTYSPRILTPFTVGKDKNGRPIFRNGKDGEKFYNDLVRKEQKASNTFWNLYLKVKDTEDKNVLDFITQEEIVKFVDDFEEKIGAYYTYLATESSPFNMVYKEKDGVYWTDPVSNKQMTFEEIHDLYVTQHDFEQLYKDEPNYEKSRKIKKLVKVMESDSDPLWTIDFKKAEVDLDWVNNELLKLREKYLGDLPKELE